MIDPSRGGPGEREPLFAYPIKILFQHCDPAGIVFYPRYFEMVNETVEAWFETAIGYSFATMMFECETGVPAVTVSAEFHRPSRMGDEVLFTLKVERIGASSTQLFITASAGEEKRLSARLTIVHVSAGKAAPWPDVVRARMANAMVSGKGAAPPD